MIIWITEGDRHEAVLLCHGKTVIRVLGRDAFILFHNAQYYLHLPRGLTSDHSGPLTHETRIRIKDETESAFLAASFYGEDYGSFRKLCWSEDLLTLGSDIEDDLYLQDANVLSHQFVFDRTHHLILDRYETGTAMADRHTVTQNAFHNGTSFRVNNVQIVLHESFLMVNRVRNLYTHLSAWSGREAALPPLSELPAVTRFYQPDPLLPSYEVLLPEPLPFQEKEHNPLLFMMGPALTMSSASMAAGLISAYNGWLQGREWIDLAPSIILPFVMVLSTLLWNPMQRLYEVRKEKRQKKRRLKQYQDYLAGLKEEVLAYQSKVRTETETRYPMDFLHSGRMYSAVTDAMEYSAVRFGTGSVPFDLLLKEPVRWKAEDPIPKEIQALRRETGQMDLPVIRSFHLFSQIAIFWDSECEPRFWHLFLQFLYRTGPDIAKLVILADDSFLREQVWMLELPHTRMGNGMRLIGTTLSQAQEISCALRQNPGFEIFLLLEKSSLAAPFADLEVHRIELCPSSYFPVGSDLRITIREAEILVDDGNLTHVHPDPMEKISLWDAVNLLNQYQPEGTECPGGITHSIYDLYGISDPRALNIEARWQTSLVREGICSCFGIGTDGEPITLDLSEHGQGPHGLIAGMTGSGKSELIISILLGLCMQYSPRELNLVLIDFKGGGAAQLFANQNYTIPHVAGVLSNLDSSGMERALVSFQMECQRREQLFQKMGDRISQPVMHLSSYQKHWSADLKLPYLPSLVIIVDEFAELKKERPDFMRDLISVARVGRSLGMHMILATQKPSGVVDEQIWSNTRFKICLKVQEKQDSMEMIHTPEASWIRSPGEFYLLWDGMLRHGWSAYANAPAGKQQLRISRINAMKQVEQEAVSSVTAAVSQAYEIIREILETGASVHPAQPLWCPPLTEVHRSDLKGTKGLLLGRADDYYHRAQPAVVLKERCAAVFSIDREEKSCFLRTLLYGLIETAEAEEEVFLIDDLSAASSYLNHWRNLCGILQSNEEEQMRNLLAHLEQPSDARRTLIITDTPSFYEACETNRMRLHRLLEQADRLNLRILLFFTTASSCPNRDLALLPFRLAMRNENVQDLSGIFECPVHRTVSVSNTALIKTTALLEVILLQTSEAELQALVQMKAETDSTSKPYTIQCLPEQVRAADYPGAGFPLGMNVLTYEWATLNPDRNLAVLATYEEELYAVERYLRTSQWTVLRCIDSSLKKRLSEERNLIAVLRLEDYQMLNLKSLNLPILYVGSGFHEQYQFQISYKGRIGERDGVLLERGRNQVIRLCETE